MCAEKVEEKKELDKKYKFKSLRVYSSDEWMANSTKKYRQVFDRAETSYMSAEFEFYNKLFDEEAWEVKVSMKCFSGEGKDRKELCNLESTKQINTEDNVVKIHEGWGNQDLGKYWTQGIYFWEAYLDGELISSAKFYVEDAGLVTAENNPYFTIESVKLFPGPYDRVEEDKRRYVKKFKRDETPYIWVELKWVNKIKSEWPFEIAFNFFDDAGQPKASMSSFATISADNLDVTYTTTEGWGNKDSGSWKDDKYTVHIVFMDTLVAVVPYEVGDCFEDGITAAIPAQNYSPISSTAQTDSETLDDVLKNLDALIGLQEVKRKIREHIKYIDFLKLRKEKGFEENEKLSLHSIFTGNPGTGKTTVVKLLGKIYNKMGLLSKGHVIEVGRSDLIAQFIGQTAPKVKKAIDDARGGILFIDEAYSLARVGDDDKDFGKEAIEVIIKEMSDGAGDVAIMVAGYPREMDHFIDSNPGLKSRFDYHFHFEDYHPDELMAIAEFAASNKHVTFSPSARPEIIKILTEAFRNRDRTFGNARFSLSIVDEGKMNLGLRLMNLADTADLTKEQLSTIELEDIKLIAAHQQKQRLDLQVEEDQLNSAIIELSSLIGMVNVKEEVSELVKLVRYYRETGKDILNRFSLHSVFLGNPGTGKTTVARIIGKVYKALGLLERGHIVEADREKLVAGFVGQTAIKTKQLIDEAKGGVLFIDEAYALAEGGGTDFGREAIEVILKNMEDMRGQLAVIVAGYPDNMHVFLESNPGLKSRFNKIFEFSDFSTDELYAIALQMLSVEKLTPDQKAEEHLKAYFGFLHSKKDKFFGNARMVRNVIGESIRNQQLRMAMLEPKVRTQTMMETLIFKDVEEFELKDESRNSGSLGFKLNVVKQEKAG